MGMNVAGWEIHATDVMPHLGLLQELHLYDFQLDEAKLRAAAPGLWALGTSLIKLNLGGNERINEAGWEILATDVMPHLGLLQELHLVSCKLDEAKLRAAAPGFRALGTSLIKLDLTGNSQINAAGWEILATDVMPHLGLLQE